MITYVNYKDEKYVRESHSYLSNDVESIIWFHYDKEILDSNLANELEVYYETTIIDKITPIPNII